MMGRLGCMARQIRPTWQAATDAVAYASSIGDLQALTCMAHSLQETSTRAIETEDALSRSKWLTTLRENIAAATSRGFRHVKGEFEPHVQGDILENIANTHDDWKKTGDGLDREIDDVGAGEGCRSSRWT